MNTGSHNTPAADLDIHYGFLFKKIIIPVEALDTTAICVFSLLKEVKKKTQRLCASLLERTLKLDQLKKKKSTEERVVFPRRARHLPGRCQDTIIKKATDNDAFTQLSVKI